MDSEPYLLLNNLPHKFFPPLLLCLGFNFQCHPLTLFSFSWVFVFLMFQRISKILLIRFIDPCFDFSFILTSLSTFLIFPLHLGNDTAVRSFPIGCNPDVAQKQTSASRWLVVVCMGGNRGLKVHLRCKSLHLWDVYADSVQQHRHCSTICLGQQCPYEVASCMFRQWGLYGGTVIPARY